MAKFSKPVKKRKNLKNNEDPYNLQEISYQICSMQTFLFRFFKSTYTRFYEKSKDIKWKVGKGASQAIWKLVPIIKADSDVR